MKLVVGLGNPGLKYLKNLHNLGFMAVELLAEKHGVDFNKKGFKGIYGEKNVNGEKVIFLKPQTYMNLSGECIQAISAFYKIAPQDILVLYDDLDIAIGFVRIRANGSAGTHNGMRSIVSCLNSTAFPRVRIGTKPEVNYEIIDYVLSDIRKEDEPRFRQSVGVAVDAADAFIHGKSIDDVMCKFNSFKPTV
ncbi:MAG: aminoacyl-tRNA hydrolase [Clostridia bacterium]|nr:aminoacyl-tRNA hydrolase [Clostridia bacterium]